MFPVLYCTSAATSLRFQLDARDIETHPDIDENCNKLRTEQAMLTMCILYWLLILGHNYY
eukprot:1683292-Amphidinium_carterae.1